MIVIVVMLLYFVVVSGNLIMYSERQGGERQVVSALTLYARAHSVVAGLAPRLQVYLPVTINSFREEYYGRSRSACDLCLPTSMCPWDPVRMKYHYRCIWNKEIVFNSQKLVKRR